MKRAQSCRRTARRRKECPTVDWGSAAGRAERWRYIAVSILAGLITFYWHRAIGRLRSPVLVFDAAGLALFAVSGATKALAFHAGPVAAVVLGMLTGGIVRDVLVREIPAVLRRELYAVAALVGAAVVVMGATLQLPSSGTAVVGAALCFGCGSPPCGEAGTCQ